MDKPVNNATELKPIVEKAVKALYGEAMQRATTLQGCEVITGRSD